MKLFALQGSEFRTLKVALLSIPACSPAFMSCMLRGNQRLFCRVYYL